MKYAPLTCVFFACATLALPSRADEAVPDRKYVEHYLYFDGVTTVNKQYRLFVVTRPKSGPPESLPVPASGKVEYFYLGRAVQGDTCLYAVPRTLPIRADGEADNRWFGGKTPGVLRSEPLVKLVSYTRPSDPHDTYRTRYKVQIKETTQMDSNTPRRELLLTRMENGWLAPTGKAAQTGFLLGVPVLACLGLFGRLKSHRDRE